MRLQVYCVADSAVEAYMSPFYARARGEAIRSFTDLVNNKESTVGKYPQHFALVFLGEFDDKEGKFDTKDPEVVIEAIECVEDKTLKEVLFKPDKGYLPADLRAMKQ